MVGLAKRGAMGHVGVKFSRMLEDQDVECRSFSHGLGRGRESDHWTTEMNKKLRAMSCDRVGRYEIDG